MKELALLLMVFWPGEAPVPVDATLQKAQILWQDAQAFWNAMLDGNACAVRASLNRLLRDLGARTALAQGNCQCPSCMFAIGQCAELTPDCATPCMDDPSKYCLYCVSSDGEYGRQLHEIGRFDSGEQWQQALEQQLVACGCDLMGGNGGIPMGECGTLYYRITSNDPQPVTCCYWVWRIPKCRGTQRVFQGDCALECDRPCSDNLSCVLRGGPPISCLKNTWTYYDCSNCCQKCSRQQNCGCPGNPTGQQGKCTSHTSKKRTINLQCVCGG